MKKVNFITCCFIIATTFLGFISCRLTEYDKVTFDPNAKLRFSTDTVFFDTLFSEIRSVTKRIRVYNDHENAVDIAEISIPETSPFQLTVNGFSGKSFQNTQLWGGDSLMLLLEVTIDERNLDLPYVIEENLTFNTNGNLQSIPVIAWGQDAHYLRDSILACNTVWKPGKPYLIYDHILVDSLCTLTIEKGTKIYSHSGSNIYIKGTLLVEGTYDSTVLLTNDRSDGIFENAPGQWGGIYFLEGSNNNSINNAIIRNAQNGIWLGTPDDDDQFDLIIENSIIENMSGAGIAAFTSDMKLENTVVNNCGTFVIGCLAGGNYEIVHSTFANYGFSFIRDSPTFVVTDNYPLNDGSVITAPISLKLINSIVWGNEDDELAFSNDGNEAFVVEIQRNLLKTSILDFSVNNILNEDPLFIEPTYFNYRVDTLSPAVKAALPRLLLKDLEGNNRGAFPTIGAYEINLD